jgi:hypothetical protein
MPEIEEIIRQNIPNYPTCPVNTLHQQLQTLTPEQNTEETILQLLEHIKKHEKELKKLRTSLETHLINTQLEKITKQT